MKTFIRLALGFYVLAISLGLLLRVVFLHRIEGLVFGNALHAHSHTLYFGWGGLCLSAIWFASFGRDGRQHRAGLSALAAIAVGTFVAFLHSGYGVPGIVVSSLSLIVWGWLAVLLWSASANAEGPAKGYLRTGVVYLVLAVASATARAVLLATKVEDPMWGSLAVFGFVHNFAWFLFLGAAGLMRQHAQKLGLVFDDRLLRWQLFAIAGFAWMTVPLGVAGAQGGVMGALARVGALGVTVAMLLWGVNLWRSSRSAPSSLRAAATWMALWSVAHAGSSLGGTFGLAPLATALRHPVIIYLHIFLVGLMTTSLFLLGGVITRRKPQWLWVHHVGLAVMLAGLGVASARFLMASLPLESITVGLWIAAFGAALLAVTGVKVLIGQLGRSKSDALQTYGRGSQGTTVS